MKQRLVQTLLDLFILFPIHIIEGVQQITNPRIVEHPNNSFIAKLEAATINCKVEGEPLPTVTWYHNGELITEATGDKKDVNRMVLPTGQLFFMSFQNDNNAKDDVGIYYCNATNPETRVSVVSRNATIALASIGTVFQEPPTSKDVAVGSSVTLDCRPPKGEPKPSIKWRKGSEILNATEKIWFLPNGSLHINDTRKDDVGIYICMAHNTAGERLSPAARILVKDKPRIIEGPKDTTVTEGHDARFQCRAIGDPEPVIVWKRAEANSIPGRMQINDDKSLRIEKVRISDEGSYICLAESTFGSVEAEAKLTVFSQPAFLATPMGRIVGIGRKVVFRCEVTGNPFPTLFWNKEANATLMFPNKSYGRMSVTDDGSLVIDPVLKEDAGEYVCKALSLAGSAYTKAKLDVREEDAGPPPIIDVMPYNQTLPSGETANLQCSAVGQPSPVIRWTKNGRSLSPSRENRIKLLSSGALTISELRKTDSGWYTCKALSESGETTRSAYLSVEHRTNPRITFHRPPQTKAFPNSPSKPSIDDIQDTSVQLSWKIENHQGASAVTSYSVEYFSHETGEGWVVANSNITDKSYIVTGLKPDTPYVFFVRARNSHGFSGPSPVTPTIRTTMSNKPSNHSKPFVSSHYPAIVSEKLSVPVVSILPLEVLSSTSLKVSWELKKGIMKYMEGFLVRYRLVPDLEMKQRSYPLNHNINMSSKFAGGQSKHGMRHRNRPGNNNVKEIITDGKLAAGMSLLDPPVHFRPSRHLKHSNHHKSGDLAQKSTETLSLYEYTIDTIQSNSASSHVLTNLEKFSFYEVNIQPFYDDILGIPSQSMRARTLEDVPSSPPINVQVNLIGNDTLHITWDSPPRKLCNGILRGYKIYMFGSVPKFNREIEINSSLDGVYIHNVIKDIMYGVQMSAFTNTGEGIRSETFFVGSPTTDNQKHMSGETWFIVTVIAVIGGVVWLVLCFFSTWLYRSRKKNKKLAYKFNGHANGDDYLKNSGFAILDKKNKEKNVTLKLIGNQSSSRDDTAQESCDNLINDSLFPRSANDKMHCCSTPPQKTDLNLDNFIISTNKAGNASNTLKKSHNYPAILYIPPPPEHPPPSPPCSPSNLPLSKIKKHSTASSRAKKKTRIKEDYNYHDATSSTLSQHQSKSNGVIPDRVREDFGGMVRVWSPHAMSEPECCGGQQQQPLIWSNHNKTALSSDMLLGGRHFSDNEVNPSYQICHEYSPPSPAPEEPVGKKKIVQTSRLMQLKHDFTHDPQNLRGYSDHEANISSSSSENVLHQAAGHLDDHFLTWNDRGAQDSDTNCSSIPSSIASSDISFREKVELLNAVTKAMQTTTQSTRKDSMN